MADGSLRIEGAALVEAAARLLANWRSVPCGWTTVDFTFAPDCFTSNPEDSPAASSGLAVVKESRTQMRARDSFSAMEERDKTRIPERKREQLSEWERQNPLNRDDGKNPHRTREFECWRGARGVVAVARSRPNRNVATALSFAKLPGPLEPLLLLYACEDWERWPDVRRYAVACFPHPAAIEDAMARILWRRAEASQDARAKQLGLRAATYRQQTAHAENMLREWLERGSRAFLVALWGTD